MIQPTSLIDIGTSSLLLDPQTSKPKFVSLHQSVREYLQQHFVRLERLPLGLYDAILAEVELPILMVLRHFGQNQSKFSLALNISRGILRKKMERHELLPDRHGKNK